MISPKFFRSSTGEIPLPVFFPDATRAVVKLLDTKDLESTKTNGLLINTYHLYKELGLPFIKKLGGIRKFMGWDGALISDSGGFQVGSLIKKHGTRLGKVTDDGAMFRLDGKKILLTPELSIQIQMELGVDMVVVLDDFTDPLVPRQNAKESVNRTINWAHRSKIEFEKINRKSMRNSRRPYLLGIVQGGYYQDLRKHCIEELLKIGFDGLGYGGWPLKQNMTFDYESAKTISENTPSNYLLYGLGVGKPCEIVNLYKLGYTIFDCVLPTRDARHGRLYVYKADSIEEIDISKNDFYEFYYPTKSKHQDDFSPVSMACDCLTCKNYSRSYLRHLFKIKDATAGRLATIHNLRFYSILMEKLSLFNI